MCKRYTCPFRLLIALLGLVVVSASAQFDSILKIRRMKPENAAKARPVDLTAQVVRVNPISDNLFLFDGDYGIFVHGSGVAGGVDAIRQGDIVRVRGVTGAGGYAPDIVADSLDVVGHEPVADGRQLQNNDYLATAADGAWVLVKGRILSMSVAPSKKLIQVEVSRNNRMLNIQIPYSEESEKKIREHIFSFVEFNAVIGTVFNENRQYVSRIFFVNSGAEFRIAGNAYQLNEQSDSDIEELMQFRQAVNRLVRTQGTVIHAGYDELFLRGKNAAVKVYVPHGYEAAVGDRVSVEGVVEPMPVSPAFRARAVNVVEKGKDPEPIVVTLHEPINSRLNFNLIQVEAELVDRGRVQTYEDGEIQIIRCGANDQLFDVILPKESIWKDELKPGSILRLAGICLIQVHEERSWYLDVVGFNLQLRNDEDLEILVPAPWWDTGKLLWVSGIAVAVSGLFLVWIISLRKTVDRQTRIIRDKVQREAVLDERTRMARELHDNLEQGLAGASIQLSGCKRLIELGREQQLGFLSTFQTLENNERDEHLERQRFEVEKAAAKNERALDVVDGMITKCSQESRATILELRGGLLEKMDLVSAIDVSINPLAEECGAKLDFRVEGKPVRLNLKAERNLLLWVKEAVSNAARHSSPSNIVVGIAYQADRLDIRVSDDGCGFDPETLSKPGRFGLQGMRERAKQLNAEYTLESAEGKGTDVVLALTGLKVWKV